MCDCFIFVVVDPLSLRECLPFCRVDAVVLLSLARLKIVPTKLCSSLQHSNVILVCLLVPVCCDTTMQLIATF